MKQMASMGVAVALTVALGAAGVAAQGEHQESRAVVTFETAVELPGTELPPGTYIFRMADAASRNVVQVFDEQEEEVLGQWLSTAAERPDDEVTDDPIIAFHGDTEGATPAIQFWFQPGERVGREFIYPEEQARAIANRTGGEVRTSDDEAQDHTSHDRDRPAGPGTPAAQQ